MSSVYRKLGVAVYNKNIQALDVAMPDGRVVLMEQKQAARKFRGEPNAQRPRRLGRRPEQIKQTVLVSVLHDQTVLSGLQTDAEEADNVL